MTFSRLMLLGFVWLTAGCGVHAVDSRQASYDKICRSESMTPAAAREAYWCWNQVGAKSYDEWVAFESEVRGGALDRRIVSRASPTR